MLCDICDAPDGISSLQHSSMMEHFTLRIAVCTLLLCLFAGCGDDRPERIPLKGQVLIDGEPLTHGFIQVIPDDGRPAQSQLDSEGRFELSTFDEHDGVLPGTHKVAVIALETVSPTKQKWHAPQKYTSTSTSGLTITVGENPEPVTIELTWDGGKPFVENFSAE